TATGVQTRQNADHSFAGYTYTNRQALEGARCSPQNLGERGREGPQQTGDSCGTSSSEPSTACRTRAGSRNPSSIASVPSLQRALLRPSERLGARAVEKVRARREGACGGRGVLKSRKALAAVVLSAWPSHRDVLSSNGRPLTSIQNNSGLPKDLPFVQ